MNVLVFGFYGKDNLGDELFKVAFQKLFPGFCFTFTDHITIDQLQGKDAVFFGGGSFLDGEPPIKNDALPMLHTLPIFYIGIGSETSIHHIHSDLIKKAKLVALRSSINKDVFMELNSNTIVIPDLVYVLQDAIVAQKSMQQHKSLLVIPNILVVPQYSDPFYKHTFWSKFKLEFAQFLDELIDQEYKVDFFSMCNHPKLSDSGAAIEIINAMEYRNIDNFVDCDRDIVSVSKLFSSYSRIITQRFHGEIIANMCQIPHITIAHHDKLLSNSSVSYYELTKKILNKIFGQYTDINVERNGFDLLIRKVNDAQICRT